MLNLTKLETVEIPLHKSTLWDDNVRTSGAEEGLDELIASICSVGLLQSLVVKKASRGTFIIGAGKRRFLALSQMAEKGDVKRSYAVPCRIAPDDADLTEISLAENICRLEMSPQQEVIAWRRMVDEGKSIGDIAAGSKHPLRRSRSTLHKSTGYRAYPTRFGRNSKPVPSSLWYALANRPSGTM